MYHGSEEETDYATSHMVHADRWSLWHWLAVASQYSSAPRYLQNCWPRWPIGNVRSPFYRAKFAHRKLS